MMRASAVKYYFEEHESHNKKRKFVCAQKRSMTETMIAAHFTIAEVITYDLCIFKPSPGISR